MNHPKGLLPAFVLILAPSLGFGASAEVRLRDAIAAADLDYTAPARRSEEGMPVGNGRMGSLVWTTPSALRFQINRADVFGQNGATASFPRADSDYASDCAYVDINLVQAGGDVFAGPDFHQHLSAYDGTVTTEGGRVTARVIGWPKADVMAVEIEDRRRHPEPVTIDLRMLRYETQGFTGENYKLASEHAVRVQTANHFATSQLGVSGDRITLKQTFEEAAFHDSSAVAIAVQGRACRARYLNETTVQVAAAAGRGKFTVLIGSAASFDRSQDTAALALAALDAAQARGFEAMAAETAEWWHRFWAEGFVLMSSPDKQADFVGGNYLYFMYLMNASSHGAYPPRFGGMLWYTNGDFRRWGSQYWHANTDAYYHDLMSSGHLDLEDPFFSLYFGMYDACALAARQQWGSQGIYLPEITFFDGPDRLPDSLAPEFRDLFLARKPYDQRSKEFQFWVETMNRHSSRYNFENDGTYVHGHLEVPTKGDGIFGQCTHFLSGAAGTASEFWQRYEFTGDKEWLRREGYPMIKGVAEFYRNFPNFGKEADGKYHIHHVNRIESDWDSSDTVSEIGAIRQIFPMAVAASAVLGVDEDLRPKWQDIADHVADPLPGSGRRGNFDTATAHGRDDAAAHAAARREAMRARAANRPFGSFVAGTDAIAPLGSEPELKSRFLGFDRTGGFVDAEGSGGAQIFRNRLRLREGPGATDAEHIAGLAFGIQGSLLENSVTPDLATVTLRVFAAWPKDWDVDFKLLAHGAVTVTASQKGGKIRFVELRSRLGNTCKLANPWGQAGVALYRDGKAAGSLSGATLEIPTARGETVTVVPAGQSPGGLDVRL